MPLDDLTNTFPQPGTKAAKPALTKKGSKKDKIVINPAMTDDNYKVNEENVSAKDMLARVVMSRKNTSKPNPAPFSNKSQMNAYSKPEPFSGDFRKFTYEQFDAICDLVENEQMDIQDLNSLFRKSVESGIPLNTIGEVYKRGQVAHIIKEVTNKTPQQYAFERVNSFINEGKAREIDSDLAEGLKNPKDNPCWKGYKPVGTKKKSGREVPNCVPEEQEQDINQKFRELFEGSGPKEHAQQNEEVEQIDELSNDTLKSYLTKVKSKQAMRLVHANMGVPGMRKKSFTDLERTGKSMDLARRKMTSEEVEQIDEISAATKMRYVAKAATSTNEPKEGESQSEYLGRMSKRMSGIKKALKKTNPSDRFQKESVQIPDKTTRKLRKITKQLDNSVKTHHKQSELIKKLVDADTKDVKEQKNCGCGQDPCKTYGTIQ